MSKLVRKSHNVSVLIYHYVCPAKYRKVVIDKKVDEILKEICLEIARRYQIEFIEIGTDKDHVHFLIQSVPTYSPTKIIQRVKSLTAREIFKRAPEVKQKLWGGEFWSDGYYVSTVGRYGSEETIREYVKDQGKEEEYQQLHEQQLKLFEKI
jgi:REP element-mobilizing transposase RayT